MKKQGLETTENKDKVTKFEKKNPAATSRENRSWEWYRFQSKGTGGSEPSSGKGKGGKEKGGKEKGGKGKGGKGKGGKGKGGEEKGRKEKGGRGKGGGETGGTE